MAGALGPRDAYGDLAISPDDRRVAVSTGNPEQDLWTFEISSDRAKRLTFGGGSHIAPVWSPDGRRIAFGWRKARIGEARADFGLFIPGAEGTEEAKAIAEHPLQTSALPLDWSPAGKYPLYLDRSRPAAAGLSAVGVSG
jgi:Tol biopolymer transport system component